MTKTAKKPKAPVDALEDISEISDHARLAQRIAEGADVNANIGNLRSGSPPLELAARDADAEAVRILLAAGAKPEWGKKYRYSALRNVVFHRENNEDAAVAICAMLVQAGANPNGIAQESGKALGIHESTVNLAAVNGRHKLVAKLVELGADLELRVTLDDFWRGNSTKTPLGWVKHSILDGNQAERARVDQSMIVTLLRLGADDSCLRGEGTTPFQECVALGMDAVVEYYVRERGEDLAQRTESGRTLLQLARHEHVKDLLKALKTELIVKDVVNGQTGNASARVPHRSVSNSL